MCIVRELCYTLWHLSSMMTGVKCLTLRLWRATLHLDSTLGSHPLPLELRLGIGPETRRGSVLVLGLSWKSQSTLYPFVGVTSLSVIVHLLDLRRQTKNTFWFVLMNNKVYSKRKHLPLHSSNCVHFFCRLLLFPSMVARLSLEYLYILQIAYILVDCYYSLPW